MRFFGICITLLFAMSSNLSAFERKTGTVEDAHYIIDVPAEPSGDVMFIARGYRPDFFPLSAVYESDSGFYQALLNDGWIIASTSYRTNDWVVAIGGEDILNLQNYIEQEVHPIQRSFLYGETMGGGVAIWLAENKPDTFDGVFALGAHLFPEPQNGGSQSKEIAEIFTAEPRLPILFVANEEELLSSKTYTQLAKASANQPAIWSIARTGHVNVNSSERLKAIQALVAWSEGGAIESLADATIIAHPDSIAAHQVSHAASNITRIRPLYGNIYTNFVAGDLDELGIAIGELFNFTHRSTTREITFAKAYSDVPIGAWVAFIDSEGHLQISRNYANAAETLNASKGDPLILSKLD